MKRLVVLVMALVFAFCTTAMAIEVPSSEKNVKAEKAAKVSAKDDRKGAKAAAKYDRKAAKAYDKEVRKAAKAAAKSRKISIME